MHDYEESKVTTREVRRQECADQREGERRGEAGSRGDGTYTGREFERTVGTPGTWGEQPISNSLAGKIVDQLISDAEERLRQSEECIIWYEQERDTVRSKLESLRQIREQIAKDPE